MHEVDSPKAAGANFAVPYLVLASAQVAVGAAAIFARYAIAGASPLAVAASRLAIASCVLLVITALRRTTAAHIVSRRERVIFIFAGVALGAHFAGWIWSLEYTSVAISTLLVATTPIWTALYDSAVHDRHLSRTSWGAIAIGSAGLVLAIGFSTTRPPIPGHQVLGGVLATAGSFAIGAYFILVREVRDAFTTRSIVTQTYTWAAIALVIAAAGARQGPPALGDTVAWGGILAMALVSQLLGHTALNASLRWFSPSSVAFSSLVEPIAAGVLAYVILRERLTPTALAGGLLILLAIAIFLAQERRHTLERLAPRARVGLIHEGGNGWAGRKPPP